MERKQIFIKMEKILLKDDKGASQKAIETINQGYNDGLNLLKQLKNLGLELTDVKNWSEVQPHFMQQFPNSSLEFNLEASGLKKQYYEAEKLFNSSQNVLFVEPTAEELEQVRELYRTYAESEKQILAYNLIHDTIKNLNSIKSLGLPVNAMSISDVCPLMVSDKGNIEVYQPNLISFISSLK